MAARDCFAPPNPWLEWSELRTRTDAQWVPDKDRKPFLDFLLSHDEVVVDVPTETTAEKFSRLADEWENETSTVSSVTVLTSHRNYRKIVEMGWEVVPYLLADLQQNNRFWFPALYEITGIRPFDPSDAGNSREMLEAWVKWGKRKNFI